MLKWSDISRNASQRTGHGATMQPATKRFYVYVLSDDGTPFYVGKGSGSRVTDHEADAARGHACYKCNKIRKMWREGREVQKSIVLRTDDETEAYRHEAKLITHIGLGQLTNNLPGDYGVEFYQQPDKPTNEYTETEYRIFLKNISSAPKQELEKRVRNWKIKLYKEYRHEWAVCRRMHEDEKAATLQAKFEAIAVSLGWVKQQKLEL